MRFSDLLLAAIRQSEIPLRFEPGAEESVARPVTDFLRAWITAHDTGEPVMGQLLAELNDERPVPE